MRRRCRRSFAIGDIGAIARVWGGPVARITDLADVARAFDGALPVLTVDDAGEIVPGDTRRARARAAPSARWNRVPVWCNRAPRARW